MQIKCFKMRQLYTNKMFQNETIKFDKMFQMRQLFTNKSFKRDNYMRYKMFQKTII